MKANRPSCDEITERLADALEDGMSDELVKRVEKQVRDATADAMLGFEDDLRDQLRMDLSLWVMRMFEDAVEAMLLGEEEAMRRALKCEEGSYIGRGVDAFGRMTEHPVIHGKLRENGPIGLRKRLVEAHAELLKNERILDLEDQVRSLVQQNNKLARRNAQLQLSHRPNAELPSP
jgi:hypothetical protein